MVDIGCANGLYTILDGLFFVLVNMVEEIVDEGDDGRHRWLGVDKMMGYFVQVFF